MAIQSFSCPNVETFFVHGRLGPRVRWFGVSKVARRKLDMLHYSHDLIDLRSPPGNRLEGLRGGLEGLHSIRVNSQWRLVFRWTPDGPADVDIVDYH